MSMRSLESAICAEARTVLCNSKLRVKDMQEWSSGEIKPQDGEVVIKCPSAYVAVKIEHDKRPKNTPKEGA